MLRNDTRSNLNCLFYKYLKKKKDMTEINPLHNQDLRLFISEQLFNFCLVWPSSHSGSRYALHIWWSPISNSITCNRQIFHVINTKPDHPSLVCTDQFHLKMFEHILINNYCKNYILCLNITSSTNEFVLLLVSVGFFLHLKYYLDI